MRDWNIRRGPWLSIAARQTLVRSFSGRELF
jgi:hypothetical protein